MLEQSRGWYRHYKDSKQFKDTLECFKVEALIKYLKPSQCHGFKATRVKVKSMLREIEEQEDTVTIDGDNLEENIEGDIDRLQKPKRKFLRREKSRCLIVDSITEVVEALKKNPTSWNKEAVKIIAAAVTSNM